MSALASKERMLEQAGYVYDYVRMVYYNRQTKKVFSIEAIEDHDSGWLRKCLREGNGSEGWQFYFNSPPSERVKQELLSELS